jgi:fimbrial chaperone protein
LSNVAPTAVVNINNSADNPVTIQAQAFTWTQPDGKDTYEETRGFIISPPIFTVPPGGKQIVRIAMRGTQAGTVERSFRLVFREIPQAEEAVVEGPVFRISLGMNIPMYVAPATGKVAPRASFNVEQAPDNSLRLRISNDGNGNLRLTNLVVTQEDNKLAEQDVFVVLPGATGFINLPSDRVVPGNALRVQAQSNGGPVDASVQPPKR